MDAVIECSGYKDNQFVFLTSSTVSKNSVSIPVQTLNFISDNQTSFNLPLESLQGYPKPLIFSKCAYAESTGSIYASFQNGSNSGTSFYEIHIGQKTASFWNPNILINNNNISSFVFNQRLNNTPCLSYISNNTLNFKSFNESDSLMTVPLQQQQGILMSARNDTQVFIASEYGFIQYNMTNKKVQEITASTGIDPKSDTDGQVISVDLEDYIIFRRQNSLHIIQYNDTQSNYTDISSFFNTSSTSSSNSSANLTVTASSIMALSTVPATVTSKVTQGTNTTGTTIIALSSAVKTDPCALDNKNKPNKRTAVTTANKSSHFRIKRQVVTVDNGNPIQTFDYNMGSSGSNIVNVYAIPDRSQSLPFDIKSLSATASGYMLGTMEGNTLLGDPGSTSINSITTESGQDLSKGDIAGIVIGVVFFIIIIGAAVYYFRRRRNAEQNGTKHIINSNTHVIDNEKYSLKDFKELSHTTSCSYDPKNMIYIDGRPDISPLKYVQNVIDFADLSGEELQKVEPDVRDKLVLFGGLYTSPETETLIEYGRNYAIRSFSTNYNQLVTVHYFNESLLKSFINSAYALSSFTLPSPHMVKHMRAIVLSQATPKNNYRYIWITSPVKPEFSLYNVLFSKNLAAIQIDKTDTNFQIWSIYSMMKSILALHSHHFVHINITPDAFFYEDPKEVTDWKLYAFGYTLKEDAALEAYHPNPFSAPELILETHSGFAKKEIDIWSLGCTIYTLVTGKLLFETADQVKYLLYNNDNTGLDMSSYLEKAFETVGLVNETFEQVIRLMLQILPGDRKSINEIIQAWDHVYNMS